MHGGIRIAARAEGVGCNKSLFPIVPHDIEGADDDRNIYRFLAERGAVAVGKVILVSGGATQEHLIHFGQDYPLKRAGQPAELASIYVQLAANDASYTTGNIYGAGGGKGQP
jgi:hypothetical protein